MDKANDAALDSQLVIVGASAGGIDALSTLVATLPQEFPAPIVIAQHLDPRRASHLEQIFGRRTALPVRNVEEREKLEPGVIYLIPANRHAEITDHEVRVRSADGGVMPSIDMLLTSAAEVFGERLIAVVLTGMGSDGALGARAVKEAGGTVVIQDPATATFPAMPASLAPSSVDIVAELDTIGPLLHDLLTGAYLPNEPRDERVLRVFLEQLRQRSGIDFTAYKRPTILRRLQRRMVATGATKLRDYVRYIERHPDEYQRLVSSFLIKVTEFFRDPELFDHLRSYTLPRLIEEARHRGNELRVWSAGCATGEEAYSLAMLVADVLGEELDRFNVRIFATDLDDDAVTFARRGLYPSGALANTPPEIVERYFSRVDDSYEVRKFVRALVIFGQHDLGQRAPFPRIDLALCRNVLIYFTTELQKRALQLFAFALRDGGSLVLGKSETTSPLGEYFALEDARLKIYRRQGEPVLMPPGRIRDATPTLPVRLGPRRSGRGLVPTTPPSDSRMAPAGDNADRVLYGVPIGVIVVDRRYDIQRINSSARRLLGIHRPAVGEDLVHLVRLPNGGLRAAIDAAVRGEIVTLDEVRLPDVVEPTPRVLRITCAPNPIDGAEQPSELAMVVVVDVSQEAQRREELEQMLAEVRAELDRARAAHGQERDALLARAAQLEEAHRELLEANQDLIAANSELTHARDAYLIGNEEAQAAIEEVETLNEELQASNEELETLNEELQSTVEELNTTNEDLAARAAEARDLTGAVEGERARLSGILAAMPDPLLVVDQTGRAVLTNPAYEVVFSGTSADVDERGRTLPETNTPRMRAARAETFSMTVVVEVEGRRRRFEARGQPVLNVADAAGVVTFREL